MTHNWGVGQYFLTGLVSLAIAFVIAWFVLSFYSFARYGEPNTGRQYSNDTKSIGPISNKVHVKTDQPFPVWRWRGQKYWKIIKVLAGGITVISVVGFIIYLIGRVVAALL